MHDGDHHHPDAANENGGNSRKAQRLAEEDETEQRRLDRLGLGIGGADREVAEGKEIDEQQGADDLTDRADEGEQQEPAGDRGRRLAAGPQDRAEIERGERHAEKKPHEGDRAGGQLRFQMLLQTGPYGLQYHRRNGYGDPQLHRTAPVRPCLSVLD